VSILYKKTEKFKTHFKEENDGGCFDFTNSYEDNGIVNMLNICTGLETTPTDGLPLFICTECYQKLLDSHSFRNQCIESVDKLQKLRENINNVKKEDDDSNDQNSTFFADSFADDDGWDHDQDDGDNYSDQKMGNCRVVVEPMKQPSPKRKPTTKRKPPAKRKSKVAAKRKKGTEEPETVDNAKSEMDSSTLNTLEAVAPADDLKPELDPVTGEIVLPSLPVHSQENKPNRKRDRTKGPKVKKEKKPYVRKPNKPEQCDVCGFISRSLKSHMLVHTQERNFECDFCGKKFALRASLKNHIFAHINIRPYQCQFCEYSSLNSHTVRKHQFVHIAPSVLETCQICNRQFKTKDNLRSHMDSHNPKKIFSCDHCDKTFNNLRGLKSHVGVHTGIRPFSCGICSMTFVNTSSACVHRRVHQINGKFCCVCGTEIKHFKMFQIHLSVCSMAIAIKDQRDSCVFP